MSKVEWFIEPIGNSILPLRRVEIRGLGDRLLYGPCTDESLKRIAERSHFLAFRKTDDELPELNPYWTRLPPGTTLKDYAA